MPRTSPRAPPIRRQGVHHADQVRRGRPLPVEWPTRRVHATHDISTVPVRPGRAGRAHRTTSPLRTERRLRCVRNRRSVCRAPRAHMCRSVSRARTLENWRVLAGLDMRLLRVIPPPPWRHWVVRPRERPRPVGTLRVPHHRASGGIGRRAGFRCLCPKGCGGSSPPSPTSVGDTGASQRARSTTMLSSLPCHHTETVTTYRLPRSAAKTAAHITRGS
jgi:hypothetical protein